MTLPKFFASFFLFFFLSTSVHAQRIQISPTPTIDPESTESAKIATDSAGLTIFSPEEQEKLNALKKEDVTKPEETEEKQEVFELFNQRPARELTPFNAIAFTVQRSVSAGVPANTIMLILLLPLLATVIAFFRHVVGVPSLEMLVPIALSITLLATGVTAGLVLLTTIIFASIIARIILKKIRIMQLPKMALSVFVVSVFVFVTLTISAIMGILTVKQLSIFPLLLLILLSERIVSVQLERSTREAFNVTFVTIIFALIGYLLLSSVTLRTIVLLYPETVFLLIPINIAIGRYFGLRVTEYFRFADVLRHGSK